jgi:DNA-binding CsgD family transcriptional regulator
MAGPDADEALLKVVDVARDVRSCPGFHERMAQTHATLAKELASIAWSTWVCDPADPSRLAATHNVSWSIDPARLAEYVESYRFLDPMAPSFLTARRALLSQFVPGSAYGADPFTADFLAPQGIRHILGLASRLPDGLILVSAFHRGPGRTGDFTADECLFAERAFDHLGRAAFGAMLREKVARLLSDATASAPAGSGALIFDALGDVVHADAGALKLLRELESLGALEALSDDAVTLAGRPCGGVLERRCPLSRARSLHARLAGFAFSGGERGVLVTLVEEQLDPLDARLRHAGLTARERVIARLAADGHGNDGIAFHLGIAPATVAVHLTRIFRKTGVTGRVALARWVHGR